MRKTLTAITALAVAVAFAAPHVARADRKNPLAGADSTRHRPEMRKNRLELTPQLVVSMNQDFRHFIGGGLVLHYHITDWFGIAVSVAGGGGIDSGLTSRINEQLKVDENDPGRPFSQPTQAQFRAHVATTNLLLSGYLAITPIAGKMALFGALFLRYDLYGMAGVGVQNLTNGYGAYNGTKTPASTCTDQNASPDPNTCDPGNTGFKFSGMFGVGAHLYFNDWLGLNMEIRDFLNSTNPAGLDVNGDRLLTKADETISNNLFVGVGLTFMLPTTAKISR